MRKVSKIVIIKCLLYKFFYKVIINFLFLFFLKLDVHDDEDIAVLATGLTWALPGHGGRTLKPEQGRHRHRHGRGVEDEDESRSQLQVQCSRLGSHVPPGQAFHVHVCADGYRHCCPRQGATARDRTPEPDLSYYDNADPRASLRLSLPLIPLSLLPSLSRVPLSVCLRGPAMPPL